MCALDERLWVIYHLGSSATSQTLHQPLTAQSLSSLYPELSLHDGAQQRSQYSGEANLPGRLVGRVRHSSSVGALIGVLVMCWPQWRQQGQRELLLYQAQSISARSRFNQIMHHRPKYRYQTPPPSRNCDLIETCAVRLYLT